MTTMLIRTVTSRGRGRWTGFGTVEVAPVGRRTPAGLLRLEVEVHNGSDRPVLFSPDQFRLRAAGGSGGLAACEAGWTAGLLDGLTTVASWLHFPAPAGASDLWLEYDEPGGTAAQAFPVLADGGTGSAMMGGCAPFC